MNQDKHICIIGAGPTGLALAYYARKRNPGSKITLIEKNKNVGGAWNDTWTDSYFTHHSPKVISSAYVNTFELWRDAGIRKTFLQHHEPIRIVTMFNQNTTWSDKLCVSYFYTLYTFGVNYKSTTVSYLTNQLSIQGKHVFEQFCVLLDGVSPDILTLDELFGSFDQTFFYSLYQMKYASDTKEVGYSTQWLRVLRENKINVILNTPIDSIRIIENKLYVNFVNEFDTLSSIIPTQVLLAMDSLSTQRLLSNSSADIQTNWDAWNKLQLKLMHGVYTSLSIQLHYKHLVSSIKIPDRVRLGFCTEFGIVCDRLPATISDLDIISCSILNMNKYSTALKKYVYECTPDEIKQEVSRQLTRCIPNLISYTPTKITIGHDSIWSETRGWSFTSSATARTIVNVIKPYGKRSDIAIIGSLNKRRFKATTMESAVESAALHFNIPLKPIHLFSNLLYGIMIIIVMFFVI